jgi:hypothetical protein
MTFGKAVRSLDIAHCERVIALITKIIRQTIRQKLHPLLPYNVHKREREKVNEENKFSLK